MGKGTGPYAPVRMMKHWIPYVILQTRTIKTVRLHGMFLEVFEIKKGSYLQHALNHHSHDNQA